MGGHTVGIDEACLSCDTRSARIAAFHLLCNRVQKLLQCDEKKEKRKILLCRLRRSPHGRAHMPIRGVTIRLIGPFGPPMRDLGGGPEHIYIYMDVIWQPHVDTQLNVNVDTQLYAND